MKSQEVIGYHCSLKCMGYHRERRAQCLHTAEVTGSSPVSPTGKVKGLEGISLIAGCCKLPCKSAVSPRGIAMPERLESQGCFLSSRFFCLRPIGLAGVAASMRF